MNFNEAEQDIRAHFSAAWSDLTPIAWPDLNFTIPDGTIWVRFNNAEFQGSQISMGSPTNNRFRQFGVVTLQIFQPQGQASSDARSKAVTAINAFKGVTTTNGVKFYDVYSRNIGNDGNGWFQINVISSYYYDDIT